MPWPSAGAEVGSICYSGVIAITVYAVLDLEYSRFGLIRLDAADPALRQLRDSIH